MAEKYVFVHITFNKCYIFTYIAFNVTHYMLLTLKWSGDLYKGHNTKQLWYQMCVV
jgi:hypothetical protein